MKRNISALAAFAVVLVACEWRVENHHPSSDPSALYGGAGSGSASDGDPPDPATCAATEIDRKKELLVTNRSVLEDRRARNDVAGAPWSFRSRLEELAGGAGAAPAFAADWLEQWATVTAVGPDAAPVEARPRVREVLGDPWRALGDGYTLPLDRTPFRLLAIVNRLDLRDGECTTDAGELRFVYAATGAKDGKSTALAMTVIVEIPYPSTTTSDAWARRWHALGQLPFGAEYNDALEAITRDVTAHAPRATIRVRTDEAALSTDERTWELREFGLDDGGHLVVVPLLQTPRIDLLKSASLDAWASDRGGAIESGTYVLPGAFQGGAAPMPSSWFRWESSRMDPDVRRAFSLATCNGCHGGERGGDTLSFQHIAAPGAAYYGIDDGETLVSRYLDNGSGRGDELERRGGSMIMALCAQCGGAAPQSNHGGYLGGTPDGGADGGAAIPTPPSCPSARTRP